MRRQVFFSLLLVLIISSCTSSEDHKHLVFWSSNNAQEIMFSKKLIDRWNEKYPEKYIHFQPIPEGQSSEEIILASVVGKTTPDIYANMWQGTVEMYAGSGVLVPLDTLDSFLDFIKQRCSENVIGEITASDGHIYQVPWKVNPIILLYNKGLFQSVGIDSTIETYSQYLDAAAKIQHVDKNGYVDRWIGSTSVNAIWYQRLFNFYPLYLAATNGAPLIKDNRAAFNNKYAVGVFRFLQELYNKDFFSRQQMSTSQDPFITGKVASLFTGPWQIPYLEKYKSDSLKYDFSPMLVPDGHTGPAYTYGDPKNIVIFNTCKDPQTAWEFIKTMITKKGDLSLLETTGQFPRRKNIGRDPYFSEFLKKNPKLKIFAHQVDHIKGIDNNEQIVEVLDIISQEYEECVVYNRKTPEKAVADAEKAVNVLLGK